jgi:hypothetical protein
LGFLNDLEKQNQLFQKCFMSCKNTSFYCKTS